MTMVLSADEEHDPDVLAINAASTALVLSEIPFYNPVGAVRVGLIDGELVFNPTNSQRDVSDLDLVVVGTEEAVVMVEAGANQLPEQVILDAIFRRPRRAAEADPGAARALPRRRLLKPMWQEPERYPAEWRRAGRRRDPRRPQEGPLHQGQVRAQGAASRVIEAFPELARPGARRRCVLLPPLVIDDLEEELLAEAVLEDRLRFDDRVSDEIRNIAIETGVLPRTHGSALFTRGETQALVTATLGTRRDAQIVEEYAGETLQKFLLHYNFPPFSVGEVKPCAAPAAARSATASWPAGRSRRCCRTTTSSPTPSAWSPTSWSRTAPRRWPPSAAARSASSTPACRCWRRWPAWRWA